MLVDWCGGEESGRVDGDDAIRVLVLGRCVQMLWWMLDECGVCLGLRTCRQIALERIASGVATGN